MTTKAQDTKSKFASIDELVNVGADVSAISKLEAELDKKIDAEIEIENAEIDQAAADAKAAADAEEKARALELDKINRTEGAVDRIQDFCHIGATAEKIINDRDAVSDKMDAEIAKITEMYGADRAKADKKVSAVLHMVRENLEMLKEDYPFAAGDCITGVVADRLNPVAKKKTGNGGGRSKEPDFIAGQDVFMTFKTSNFKSIATDTGVMLYGEDMANSTASKMLADEFEPRADGKPNNLGKYWKGTSVDGVKYLDVSKAR